MSGWCSFAFFLEFVEATSLNLTRRAERAEENGPCTASFLLEPRSFTHRNRQVHTGSHGGTEFEGTSIVEGTNSLGTSVFHL